MSLRDEIDALVFKKVLARKNILVPGDDRPFVSLFVDGNNTPILKLHVVDGNNIKNNVYYWVDP